MIFESLFEYPMTHLDNFWVLFWVPHKASGQWWHGGSSRYQQRNVTWQRISCVGYIEQVSSRRRAQTRWCSEQHDQVRFLHNLSESSKGGRRVVLGQECLLYTSSWEEVVPKVPRTAAQEQLIQRKKVSTTRVGMGELLLQTENGPPQRCAHWAKRARYAATRSTSSKKCDEQLRIKSSASGSWSNRSNFLGLPLLVLLSLRIHYASLHICRFLCEVACLSVKWTMYTHSKHVIMRIRTVLSRTWLQVQEALKVKFRHTAQQDHRRIQQEVIQHNILHSCAHLHRFLHRCVQSMNFSDHSRSVLFFSPSLISLLVSLLLSQDTMFFFTHIIPH